jgi:hypothetical protein
VEWVEEKGLEETCTFQAASSKIISSAYRAWGAEM